jgi:hypothetical protein
VGEIEIESVVEKNCWSRLENVSRVRQVVKGGKETDKMRRYSIYPILRWPQFDRIQNS